MGLRKIKHAVLPEARPFREGGESRIGMLRRLFVECPQCNEVWLVVGARENDRHMCKGCGHVFDIRFPVTRESELSPASDGCT